MSSLGAQGAAQLPVHRPVLLDEVVRLLTPLDGPRPMRILDCTLGLGEHAKALLQASGTDAQLIR
jgi:16S rRNA C1402 N4-methylase RsmH